MWYKYNKIMIKLWIYLAKLMNYHITSHTLHPPCPHTIYSVDRQKGKEQFCSCGKTSWPWTMMNSPSKEEDAAMTPAMMMMHLFLFSIFFLPSSLLPRQIGHWRRQQRLWCSPLYLLLQSEGSRTLHRLHPSQEHGERMTWSCVYVFLIIFK